MIDRFKLEDYLEQQGAKAAYCLANSDCEPLSFGELLALEPSAEALLRTLDLGYTETAGDPLLREAIADTHFRSTANDIVVLSGEEEPTYIFIRECLNPGDHVIMTSPCHQMPLSVARAQGCVISEWPVPFDPTQSLNVSELDQLMQPNTRALIINFPHNPTGYLPKKTEFVRLLDFAQAHRLMVLSDESFRLLEYDSQDRLPVASDLYDRAISVSSMTKAFGLGGLRIGWASCVDPVLLKRFVNYRSYTTVCNSAPSEFLATLALRHFDAMLERNTQLLQENLKHLEAFFAQYPVLNWVSPKATPIAFPHLARELEATDFCRKLAQEASILLVPGGLFQAGETRVRLGFGRKGLPATLKVFGHWIESAKILL